MASNTIIALPDTYFSLGDVIKSQTSPDVATGSAIDKDTLISALIDYICIDKPDVGQKLKDYLTEQKVIKDVIDIDERDKYLDVLRRNINASQLTPFNTLTSRYHNDFHEVNKLSQGAFGVVYKAIHKIDQKNYAIKKIPIKGNFTSDDLCNINEVKILAKVNHPSIVRYTTTWIEFGIADIDDFNNTSLSSDSLLSLSNSLPQDGLVVYNKIHEINEMNAINEIIETNETKRKTPSRYSGVIYIQMELCAATLKEYLHEFRPNNNIKYKIILDILHAVNYLHTNGIIHNDLSLRNILVDDEQNIKICDFGLADIIGNNECIIKEKKYGNTLYLAPECRKHGKYSRSSDIYSLGIIFTEIYKNYMTEMERICEISKLKAGERIEKDEHFAKVISLMINNNPKCRPTTAMLMRNMNTN